MLNHKGTATDATRLSEVDSRVSHISTAPPPPPPDSSLVLSPVGALATVSTPATHPALHSSEADALSASLGLPDGMIQTGSDDDAVDGDASISFKPPSGRCRGVATTYDSRGIGEHQPAANVEN